MKTYVIEFKKPKKFVEQRSEKVVLELLFSGRKSTPSKEPLFPRRKLAEDPREELRVVVKFARRDKIKRR